MHIILFSETTIESVELTAMKSAEGMGHTETGHTAVIHRISLYSKAPYFSFNAFILLPSPSISATILMR